MEAFEYMKANGVVFSKPKEKWESYFATDKNNNSYITSDKTPKKQIA